MKLARVVYTLYKKNGRKEFEYVLNTDDLSIEEFATLKVLLERSGILDTHPKEATDRPLSDHLSIRVTTADGFHTAYLDSAVLSDEMAELVDFLKGLVGVEHPMPPFSAADIHVSPHLADSGQFHHYGR